MEIKYWDGGLTLQEVEAIEKIKENFTAKTLESQSTSKDKPLKSLKALNILKTSNMFLWKGYAGFRLIGHSGYEGEYDLVIVTHYCVLVVELKHWNGKITYSDDIWYQNGEYRGRSPVHINQNKVHVLRKKLENYKNKFTNKGFVPFVQHIVIMTGQADYSSLPEEQRHHIITLDDFLKLNEEENLYKRFGRPRHKNTENLNKDFNIFDEIFGNKNVEPKPLRIHGYLMEGEADFIHRNKIYEEFLAKSENPKHQLTDIALIRRWDFDKVESNQSKTPEGRFKLISREYEVLEAIKIADEELYSDCLIHKKAPNPLETTSKYFEIFSILPNNKRFNAFIEQHAKHLSESERLGLVEILLSNLNST